MDPRQAQPAQPVQPAVDPVIEAARIAAFNDGRVQAAAEAQALVQQNQLRIANLEAQTRRRT